MEALIYQYRIGNNMMVIGKSEYPIHWIAAEDFGKQVVKSFEIDNETNEYIIQGLEAINVEEACVRFANNYQKMKLKVLKLPIVLLKLIGIFSNTLTYGAKITNSINKYPEKFESQKTWNRLGKPIITIEKFASLL